MRRTARPISRGSAVAEVTSETYCVGAQRDRRLVCPDTRNPEDLVTTRHYGPAAAQVAGDSGVAEPALHASRRLVGAAAHPVAVAPGADGKPAMRRKPSVPAVRVRRRGRHFVHAPNVEDGTVPERDFRGD